MQPGIGGRSRLTHQFELVEIGWPGEGPSQGGIRLGNCILIRRRITRRNRANNANVARDDEDDDGGGGGVVVAAFNGRISPIYVRC